MFLFFFFISSWDLVRLVVGLCGGGVDRRIEGKGFGCAAGCARCRPSEPPKKLDSPSAKR